MEGIFYQKKKAVKRSAMMLAAGVVIIGGAVWMALTAGYSVPFDAVILIMLISSGAIMLTGGAMTLASRAGARFQVDADKVRAKLGMFKRIDAPTGDIIFAHSTSMRLFLSLKNGREYAVSGLANAKELCGYILSVIPPFYVDPDIKNKLKEECRRIAAKRKHGFLFLALVIVLVLVAGPLADGVMEDAGIGDLTSIIISGGVTCVLVISSLFVVSVFENGVFGFLEVKTSMLRRIAVELDPLPPGELKAVFTDDEHTERVTVIGVPESDEAYYVVEKPDENFDLEMYFRSDLYESAEAAIDALDDDLFEIT